MASKPLELLPFSIDRMVSAVEKVRERLLHSTAALERHGIDYAVAGGNAVAAWVARCDASAVRNTRDVNILVRRGDIAAVHAALAEADLVPGPAGAVMASFIARGDPRGPAVRLLFVGEEVRSRDAFANPDVREFERSADFRFLPLAAWIQMKLVAHRSIDRVHLRDLIDVGCIDETWPGRFVPELAARLRSILNEPEG